MDKQIKYCSINYYCLIFIIPLSSFVVSENVFSRNKWDKSFVKITREFADNSIVIGFVVFDYYFPVNKHNRKHAYLEWCDFRFTTNGKKYTRLMRVETYDQDKNASTILKMSFKCKGEDIRFLGCRRPPADSWWLDSNEEVTVEVINDRDHNEKTAYAQFTVKWLPSEKYKNANHFRLNGNWVVKGEGNDEIKEVLIDFPSGSMLNSAVIQSENNSVKVTTDRDAIVITGAANGDGIKVYNLAGVVVQSTVANSEVMNIKLPKNQIYFVNTGLARYKIALEMRYFCFWLTEFHRQFHARLTQKRHPRFRMPLTD